MLGGKGEESKGEQGVGQEKNNGQDNRPTEAPGNRKGIEEGKGKALGQSQDCNEQGSPEKNNNGQNNKNTNSNSNNGNSNNNGNNNNAQDQGRGNTPYDNHGQGLKKGLYKNLPDAKKGQYKLNQTETRYQYTGLSSMVHKEYSEKGSPYAEYHMGAENQVVSRKMFGLHGLVNPGHEPSLNTTGGLLYYQYDGQSTVSEVTDRHGDVTEQYRYDAFGGILTGITAPYNTVGYTGHHYDDKTGLIDMKARWYDPTAGRFSTPDTYPGTLHEPFTQHRYAYVGNNPINMWDPTGHVPQWVRDQGSYDIWNITSSTASLDIWVITDYTPCDSGWQHTHTEKALDYHYKYYKKTEYEEWEYIHFNFLWDILVDKETGDEYWEPISSGSSTGTFSELSVYHYQQTIPASELAILNREMIKNHGDPPKDAKPSWTTSAVNDQVIENNPLLGIHSKKFKHTNPDGTVSTQSISNRVYSITSRWKVWWIDRTCSKRRSEEIGDTSKRDI